MQELGFFLFFLAYWFVIPYALGTLFFNRLKKKWKGLGSGKGAMRFIAFLVLLLCALVGWLIEMLALKGILMML